MNTDKKIFDSYTEADTEQFASQFISSLPRGSVVALHGDLGAGKTVFARGAARGLGITGAVSSPTYTIVQEYDLPGGGRFYHLDLYRISDEYAALGFGVDEFLDDKNSITLLEWPERISGLLPPETIHLRLSHCSTKHRKIEILPAEEKA
jgi:tRNA threonylcarbamoyladenosine biosynthesis protein TsaE